jgi:hypothetical protein
MWHADIGIGANWTEISHWRFRTVNPLTIGAQVAFRYSESFGQTCAVPSEELARSCKNAKEQIGFGFTATVGGLNLTSEILCEILKPIHRAILEIVSTFRTPDSVEMIVTGSKSALLRQIPAGDPRPDVPEC